MPHSGWLDPELSPQQILQRLDITAEDMLTPLYGEADTAGTTVIPGVGALTATGFAPTIGLPVTITPGLGQATFTGFVPTITLPTVLQPGSGQGVWTGFAGTIGLPVTMQPGLGLGTFIGLAPTVNSALTISPNMGTGTFTGFAPTVFTPTPVTITPGLGQGTWTGFAPQLQLIANTGGASRVPYPRVPYPPLIPGEQIRLRTRVNEVDEEVILALGLDPWDADIYMALLMTTYEPR